MKKMNVYIAASDIEDKEVRTVIQDCLEKNLAESVRGVRSTTDPVPPAPRAK